MQLRDTIRHYAWVIRYRSLLIFLGTVVCATATFVTSICLPPVYQASTLVMVNEATTNSSNEVFSNQALALSYSLLVTRDDVLQAVARKLPGTSVSQLKAAVSDAPIDNTQIIEIRVQASTPKLAMDIANEVATVFIQVQISKETADLQHVSDQLSSQLTVTKANVDAAQARLTALQNAHASQEFITQQKNMLGTYQENYTTLLATSHDLQQRQLQMTNALSIAQLATPPDKPASPQIVLNTSVAALMGLLLMIVLALLFDWLDVTIKTPEDVAQLTRLEALGSVPFSAPSATPPHLPILHNPAVEDAFVAISTNFSALSKEQRLVLVTALHADAGTSTTAANLALALAHSGLRVLLVDAHLRNPVLHEIFHCPNTRGLLNSLTDMQVFRTQPISLLYAWLHQWSTGIPNLWLLPAGSAPEYIPLRLPELRQLCSCLLGSQGNEAARTPVVDIILFDAAPLYEGGDTLALAAITGASVLVIEAGREQREILINAQKTLQRPGSPIVGVVVNRQRAHHRTYFYVDYDQQAMLYPEHTSAKTLQEQSASYAQDHLPETPAQLSIVPETSPELAVVSGMSSPYTNMQEMPAQFSVVPETPTNVSLPSMSISEIAGDESEVPQQDFPVSTAPGKTLGMSLPGLKALSPDKVQRSGLRHYYNSHEETQKNK